MSSDKLHIDRSNYEEYFLLYLDGELSIQDKISVERFVAFHPDLQQELTILLSTRLEIDAVIFGHKEDLSADNMKLHTADESLLLYIDNELNQDKKRVVATRLQTDSNYNSQYQQLQKAKLDASDFIHFPNKKELYRSKKRRAVPLIWFRVAAAVIILLATGLVWLREIDINESPALSDIQNIKSADTLSRPTPLVVKPESTPNPIVAKTQFEKKPNKVPAVVSSKKETITAKKESEQTNNSNKGFTKALKPEQKLEHSAESDKHASKAPLQQELNTSVVTTNVSPTYNQTEATVIPSMAKNTAAFADNRERKGSVRGFLRKASRFIERRTGINPVNDDKELYVGVVAIKL